MRSYWPKGDRNEAPLSQAPPPPDSCLAGLPIITAVVLNSVPLQGMGVQASVPPLKALVPALGDGGWVKPVKLSGPGEMAVVLYPMAVTSREGVTQRKALRPRLWLS